MQYKKAVELHWHGRIEELRSDCGGEYTSLGFEDYANEEGFKLGPTAPYSPESNGAAPRASEEGSPEGVGMPGDSSHSEAEENRVQVQPVRKGRDSCRPHHGIRVDAYHV